MNEVERELLVLIEDLANELDFWEQSEGFLWNEKLKERTNEALGRE